MLVYIKKLLQLCCDHITSELIVLQVLEQTSTLFKTFCVCRSYTRGVGA